MSLCSIRKQLLFAPNVRSVQDKCTLWTERRILNVKSAGTYGNYKTLEVKDTGWWGGEWIDLAQDSINL